MVTIDNLDLSRIVRRLLAGSVRGMRTVEITKALGISGDLSARRSLAICLETLLGDGAILRETDQRWRWHHEEINSSANRLRNEDEINISAPAKLFNEPDEAVGVELDCESSKPSPSQLLAYFHAVLRSDVRGQAKLLPDKHGHSWHMIQGFGEWWPKESVVGRIDVSLDALQSSFRTSLERRADDDTIAVGWGLASGRDSGVDVVWPVGLLAGRWWREHDLLRIALERPDVMVNPAWIGSQAGAIGWSQRDLIARLGGQDENNVSLGLDLEQFGAVLREAAAPLIRSHMRPARLDQAPVYAGEGIWGAAALILPEERSMSRAAVRDLDKIRSWDSDVLSATAVQALLAPKYTELVNPLGSVLETVPLNGEQLDATRSGLSRELTVVTGPPGTGKSQIVSALVSSAVLAGKRVCKAPCSWAGF